MQIFSKKKKVADAGKNMSAPPAPPKSQALPPAPRPAPAKPPKPVSPPKEAPKEKVSVEIKPESRKKAMAARRIPSPSIPDVTVSVSGADIKPSVGKKASQDAFRPSFSKKQERAVMRLLDKPVTKEELREIRKEVSSMKREMRKSAPKIGKPKAYVRKKASKATFQTTKTVPIVNISIFDRKEGKEFSVGGREQPSSSRQAPKLAIAPKKPAAVKAEKAAPIPARIAKPVQTKTGESEIKDIKKTVTSMKKDIEAVKAKTGKLPERKHEKRMKAARPPSSQEEEIKKIVKKIPSGKKAGKKKPWAMPPKHKHHMIKPVPEDEIRDLRTSVRETDKSVTRIARDLMKVGESLAETREDAKNAYMGPLSDSDVKIIKNFVSRSGDFEKSAAGVNVKLDKLERVLEIFAERMGTIKKELADMKIRQATSRPGKDSAGLEERMAEMEAKLSERKGEKPGAGTREIKAVIERIAGLEKSLETMRTFRAAATSLPEASKGVTERMDSVDARITGISDKLMQLSGDAQKLTEYFMQGMRYTESRMRVIEHDMGMQNTMDMMPRPRPKPATYSPRPKSPEPIGIARDLDEDVDLMLLPRAGQPRQELQPAPAPRPYPDPSAQLALPLPPLPPVRGGEPPESTIFTKLRESTVVRKPLPRMDPDTHDVEIIVEQIGESMHRGDTREKIERDLLTAGFDAELIGRAFMQARVG